MPNIHSSHHIIKTLKKHGYSLVHISGSHHKFKNSKNQTVIVPHPKKETPYGTFRSILRQSGLKDKHFQK